MAKSSLNTDLLATNLELLFMKNPARKELQEALQKNLFSVPNQRASDELICYVYPLIDKKYNLSDSWPLLNKKMENNFYTLVHKFSKEISAEYPEEELPKVVKSFFLMPSGERYVEYLYKLTLIAMKSDLKASGIYMFPTRRPKNETELKNLVAMNNILDQVLEEQVECAVQSRIKNRKREKQLRSQLEKNRERLVQVNAELQLKVEQCSLPDHMKHRILSGHDYNVINDWSATVSQRCEKLRKDAEAIKNIKRNISQLNEAINLKKKGTLEEGQSHGSQELLNGLPREDFLNDLLRRAEETLNAHRLGHADFSPYIPDLEELEKQFKDLLGTMTNCSETMIQLHDETEENLPKVKAALFSNEQLTAENTDEGAVGYSQSLMNMLCESTPPEMLRNFTFAELGHTSSAKALEMESQNTDASSKTDAIDVAAAAEPSTPVAIDTNLLKPICFQRKSNGSGATWKRTLLLSTLKKNRQQKEKSPESFTDTPLSQHSRRTKNPVKSLNSLWTEESENSRIDCASKRILSAECPSDASFEESSLTVHGAVKKQFQTDMDITGRPGTSDSEPVKSTFKEERNKICNLTITQKHSSEDVSVENISQDLRDFLQAMTNSNGSLMSASEVFGSSSSQSPPGSTMTGIDMLEQTSTDLHISSHSGASLALWDDQKDLKRILNVALSPAGIPPAEVRSSTPIHKSSSQPQHSGQLKEDEKLRPPAAAVRAVSRIPRIKSRGETRSKKKSS